MVLVEAIGMAVSYSLLKRTKSDDPRFTNHTNTLTMHPLQQKSAKNQLSQEDQQLYTKKVMAMISSAISIHREKRKDNDWVFNQQIEPHLFACRDNLETCLKDVTLDIPFALSAHSLGVALDDLSLYQLAELPYRKALESLQQAESEELDSQETNLVKVMRSLGNNLSYQSRYKEALKFLEPILKIYEQPNRKKTGVYLATVYSIGLIYRYQGEYDKALEAYKVVYDGNVNLHNNKECTGALEALSEMGYVHLVKRNLDTAQEFLEAAFEGYKKRFGSMHPFTLTAVHLVASVYLRRGKYDDALDWYQVALAGREVKLGKEHLATLATVGGIAETHIELGRYQEGLEGYQRALDGRRKASGDKSMWTLSAVHGVGTALKGLGRYADALECFERALEGRKEILGLNHSQTLETIDQLEEVHRLLA
jgi:tetratricopeptide (TPR) repeat protein